MTELEKPTLQLTTKSENSVPQPTDPKAIPSPKPRASTTKPKVSSPHYNKINHQKGKRQHQSKRHTQPAIKTSSPTIPNPNPIDKSANHPLEHTWVLWYHDGKSDWSLESYRYIWEFSTIEDFWRLYNNLPSISNTFIFLMRKGHAPIWEVPENIKGGSWLFKFPKKVADREWLKLSLYLIGETLSDNPEHLIGLSVSPKNYNVVMRVWNKNNEACYNKLKFPPEIARYKPLYKVFQEYQETEKQEAKTVIVS